MCFLWKSKMLKYFDRLIISIEKVDGPFQNQHEFIKVLVHKNVVSSAYNSITLNLTAWI